jgi:hypothetical protein
VSFSLKEYLIFKEEAAVFLINLRSTGNDKREMQKIKKIRLSSKFENPNKQQKFQFYG